MIRTLSFWVVVSYFLGASAVASDKWYGTVTYRYQQIEDTFESRETEGTTSTNEDHFTKDLTAVVQLTGGTKGKVFIRGQSRATRSSKNVTPNSCYAAAPDLETVHESISISTHSGSTHTTLPNSWVEVQMSEDGSYIALLSIMMEIPNADLRTQNHSSTRTQCPGGIQSSRNNSVNIKCPLSGLFLPPEGKTDKPNGDHLDGSFSKTEQTARGHYTISATWNLTRNRMPRVQADPGGPYSVVRGDHVRLDGSKSKGKIEKYVWAILPGEGCPAEFEATALQGSVHEFPVLCSLRGFLVVNGDGESDRQPFFVDVRPRKWKTDFTREGEETFDQHLIPEHLELGKNRCVEEGGGDSGHFIHRDPASLSWENEGYKLSRVGQGPFAGFWFVASENLRIPRKTFINQRILPPDGEVYKLNASTNLADMNLLVEQVRDHEKLHSDLAEERLKNGSPDFDPAIRIERLFRKDREALIFDADFHVRDAETEIWKASAEQKVRDRLRKMPKSKYNRSGKLLVRDPVTGDTKIRKIPYFADFSD